MFQKSHLSDWIVFFIAVVSLYIIYGYDIKRLIESLLVATLWVTGVRLLIDYGLIKFVFSEEKIDNTMRKLPVIRSIATKKFRYRKV